MYLLPIPQNYIAKEGIYTVTYDRTIVIDVTCCKEVYAYAKMLQDEFADCTGFRPSITRGSSKKESIRLAIDEKLREEEYVLDVSQGGIRIAGGSKKGLFYGIQTLRQMIQQKGACIPYAAIRDFPAIPNRGYYYDVTRGRIPTLDWLKRLADKLAFYKINQLQLYIEHSFLFENLSEVWRDDTPLTPEDILELDAYCRERNIDLIPSLSSFGHLYKVLRTRQFSHLCELPDSENQPFGFVDRMEHHTIDVSNPESLAFVKRLIEEYLPLFSSDYFNIGADETFDLGKGRSSQLAQKVGKNRMYLDFVKELCSFLVTKGKKPMFWGDIICGFPEAVKELPAETICLNWGYSREEKEDSTQSLAHAGARQYCCPGVCGWDQFVNLIEDSYENIRRMCTYASQYGAEGVLITDWGDCGHINHCDFGMTGMIYGASFSWNQKIPSFEEINRQISRIEYKNSTEELVSILAEISKNWSFRWRDAVNHMEQRELAFCQKGISDTSEILDNLGNITARLYAILPQMSIETRHLIKPYLVAIRGMELIQKTGLVVASKEYQMETGYSVNTQSLASELEEWFYHYKEVWRSVSRESELYRVQNVVYWYADYLRSCCGHHFSS